MPAGFLSTSTPAPCLSPPAPRQVPPAIGHFMPATGVCAYRKYSADFALAFREAVDSLFPARRGAHPPPVSVHWSPCLICYFRLECGAVFMFIGCVLRSLVVCPVVRIRHERRLGAFYTLCGALVGCPDQHCAGCTRRLCAGQLWRVCAEQRGFRGCPQVF